MTAVYPSLAFHVADDVTFINGSTAVETPVDSFEDPVKFVLRIGRRARQIKLNEITVVLDATASKKIGFPVNLPRSEKVRTDHPVLKKLRADGWHVSELSPWFTLWAHGRPSIHFGVDPWIKSEGEIPCDDEASFAWRLARFQALTGAAYHGTPGLAFISILRDGYGGKERVAWKPAWTNCAPALSDCERPWARWTTPDVELMPETWHGFDARRQYLAAAHNTRAALGELRQMKPRGFDPQYQGYWLIDAPAWNIPELPNPSGYNFGARCWVTTPTMELLEELADGGFLAFPDIYDAWLSNDKVRDFFRPAVSRINTAYLMSLENTTPDGIAVTGAIKGSYKLGVGMLHVKSARVWRPDWHHSIIAKARANIFRKIFAVWLYQNIAPVHVHYDEVWYASDATALQPLRRSGKTGRIEPAFPFGDGLGQFGAKRKTAREVLREART